MALSSEFCTGFEHGLLPSTNALMGFAAAPAAGFSVVTTTPRNGAYCLQCAPAANTASTLRFTMPGTGSKSIRFGFKVVTLPSSGTSVIWWIGTSITIASWSLGLDSAGLIKLGTAGTAPATYTAGPNVNDGNWHYVEICCDVSTSTWHAQWKVDGALQTPVSQSGASGGTLTSQAFGTLATNTAAYSVRFDDLLSGQAGAPASSEFWGNGLVEGLVPGSDGTHSFTTGDFSIGDAGATQASSWSGAHNLVDELPFSTTRSTTDAIGQRVARTTGYVELAPTPTAQTSGVANNVASHMLYSSSATTANNAATIIRSGDGTNSGTMWGDLPVAQGGFGGALADYSETSNFGKTLTSLTQGTAWSPAQINAIRWRFGGSSDISPVPTLQQIMLEVDWPVSSGSALTQGITDTATVADALASLTGWGVVPADSVSVADSPSTAAGFSTSPADTATVADAQTPSSAVSATVPDTATVADSTTAARGASASPADTATVADSTTQLSGKEARIDDALSGSVLGQSVGGTKLGDDLVAWEAGASFTIDLDFVSPVNVGSVGLPILGQIGPTGTLGNGTSTGFVPAIRIGVDRILRVSTFWYGATADPSAKVGGVGDYDDGVQRHLTVTYDGTTHDQKTYIDGSLIQTWNALQSSYAPSYSYFAGAQRGTGWESIPAGDANGWSYLQSGGGVGNVVFRSGVQSPLSAPSGLADSASTATGFSRSVPDTATVADATTTAFGANATLADTAAVADAQTPSTGLNKPVADTAAVADTQTLSSGVSTAVADTAAVADAQTPSTGLNKPVADTAAVADAQAFGYGPGIADTATVADAQSFASGASALIADTVTATDDPRVPISDAFNRADENPLSGGGTWSTFAYVGQPLKLVSNRVVATGGAGTENGSLLSTTFAQGAPAEAYVDVTTVGTSNWTSIVYADSTSWSFDGFQLFYNGGSRSNYFGLDIYDPGTTHYDFGPTPLANGDAFGVRVWDRKVEVLARYSGVWVILGRVSIGTLSRPTYQFAITETSDGWALDNFGAGTPTRAIMVAEGFNTSTADSITVADTATPQSSGGTFIADTATVADAQATASTYDRTVATDAVTVADTASTAAGLNTAPTDTAAVADSQTSSIGRGVSVPDAIAVADTASPASGIASTVADAIGVADTATTSRGFAITATDAAAVADALRFDYGEGISDAISVADAQVTSQGWAILASDTLVVADLASAASAIQASLTDAISVADATATARAVQAALADTANVADVASLERAIQAALADTAAVADATTQASGAAATISDILVVADARALGMSQTIADALTVDDNVAIIGSGVSAAYIHHVPPLRGNITANDSNGIVAVVATNDLVAVYSSSGLVVAIDAQGEVVATGTDGTVDEYTTAGEVLNPLDEGVNV